MRFFVYFSFGLLLFSLIAAPSASATDYRIEIQQVHPDGYLGEGMCSQKKNLCFLSLALPLQVAGYDEGLNLDIGVVIEDDKVRIRFRQNGVDLSIDAQGYDYFFENLGNDGLEKQLINLYVVRPESKHDSAGFIPTVVRPGNIKIAELQIAIRPDVN